MSSFEEIAKEEISRNARIASSVACALGPSIPGLDWATVSSVSGIIESLWVDDEALDLKIATAKAEMALMRAAATISDFKEIATVHFVEAFLGLVGVVRNGGFTRSQSGVGHVFDHFVTPKIEANHTGDDDHQNTGGESGDHSPFNSSNEAAEPDDEEKPHPSSFSMSLLPGNNIDLSGLFGSVSPKITNGINGQHRPPKRAAALASSTIPARTEPPKKRKTKAQSGGGANGKETLIPASALRGGPLLPTGKRQWKCLLKNCTVSYDNLGGLGWHISAKHWSEGEFVACCLNCDKRLSCGRACSHAKKPQCTTANFAYWFDDVLSEKQKKKLDELEGNILGDCPYDFCDAKIESLQNLYDHGRVTHRHNGRLVFVCTGCDISMCKPSQLLKHSVRDCNGARVIAKILTQGDVDTVDTE